MKIKSGYKYHTFTVISESTEDNDTYHKLWNIVCDCGNKHKVTSGNITKNIKHKCICQYPILVEGDKIGEFTILESDNNELSVRRRFFLCKSGHKFSKLESSLINEKVPVCCNCAKAKNERGRGTDIKPGDRYQHFTIVSKDENSGGHGKHFLWNLICDCGRKHSMQSSHIRMGRKKLCACINNSEDITGEYYGNIKVIGKAGYKLTRNGTRNSSQFFCQCLKCDTISIALGELIKKGHKTSCGSYKCKISESKWKIRKDNKIYKTRSYHGVTKTFIKNIFTMDGFKCICCGRGGYLQGHHLNGWHWCKEGRLDADNIVTLCMGKSSGCHREFHKIYGKKNNTREQFDEYIFNYHGKTLNDISRLESEI